MKEKNTNFYSDGIKLDGSFYYPEQETSPNLPLVITCSGFQGLKDIHPARFARALTPLGYECFGFDYRGFAASEGTPGDVKLEEQMEDIINAASYVTARSTTAKENGIVLIGWGMGGGLVVKAAPEIDGLKGVVTVNGFYNAKRVQQKVRSREDWLNFKEYKKEARQRAATTGETEKTDPFFIYPLDDVTRPYVDNVLRKNDDFGVDVNFTFAHSLLRFNAEEGLDKMLPTPLLVTHGDSNKLHPPPEAGSLYEKYQGEKELYLIPEAGHTEWMFDDNEKFKALIKKIDKWINSKALTS